MKTFLVLVFAGIIGVSAHADVDHNNGHGNDGCIRGGNCGQTNQGPKGDTGEQGPKGDKGDAGVAGSDGKDGKAGVDGQRGRDGVDSRRLAMPVVGEIAARLYDHRYFQLQGFYGYDFRNQVNHVAGARILLKIGTSWEERRLDLLQRRIRQLELLANKYAEQLI